MAVYTYLAADVQGRRTSGVLEAETRTALVEALREKGLVPLDVRRETQRRWFSFRYAISAREQVFFFTRLGHMLASGMSIGEALGHLVQHSASPKVREIAHDLDRRLREGTPLSEAMYAHPDIFPPFYCNLVRAGEASGTLDERILELAKYVENRDRFQREVKQKIAYPLYTGVIISAVFLFYAFYVFPKVVAFFQKAFGTIELPWASHVLLFVSQHSLGIAAAFLLFGAAGLGLFLVTRFSYVARLVWDRFSFGVPVVGWMFTCAAFARVSRALGTLGSAGIPIIEAMDLAAPMAENVYLEALIRRAQSLILGGSTLGGATRDVGFPPIFCDMVASGERAGRMQEVLQQSTTFFEGEVDYQFRRLMAIVEPLMLVLMGALLALIILGVFFPLYQNLTRFMGRLG